MTTTTVARTLAGATLIATMACAGAASSQAARPAAPAGPAATPITGPTIAGVCVLNNDRLIGTSTVGKYVIQRLQQLEQAVKAELTPQGAALDKEAEALNAAKVAGTDPRVSAYQQKLGNLSRTAQIRERELQATQQKAFSRIITEADPVIRTAWQQKGCGILINRNSVLAVAPQMDITDQVVAGLNAKITQFAFERERAPTAPPAAPARQ